jgi:hypothetical protein
MLFRKKVAVYSKNHTKHINTLCEQNAELLIAKEGNSYSYNCALKG